MVRYTRSSTAFRKRSFRKSTRRSTRRTRRPRSYVKKTTYRKRALQSADTKLLKFKCTNLFSVCVSPSGKVGETSHVNTAGVTAQPLFHTLFNSKEFITKCKEFEQWKLNGARVKILPTTSQTDNTLNSLHYVTTAWDRDGIEANKIPDYSHLCRLSSKITRQCNLNATTFSTLRFIQALSPQEKNTYARTDPLTSSDEKENIQSLLTKLSTESDTHLWNPVFLMGILCMQSGAVSADAYKSASDVNTNILIPNPSTGIQSFNFILEWEFNVSFKGSHAQEDPLPMTAPHLLMLPTANVLTQTSADIVKPVAQPVVLPQVAPEFCSLYINNFKYISTAKNEYTIPSNACMAKSYAAGSVVTVNFSAIYTLAVVFTAEGVYVILLLLLFGICAIWI
ncbi:hypothetical protein EIN_004460 [Entamoeba invadens IP1]|uniref:Uncharacterized protein n=1 Tax=Entamoeba invadens IP1 TaxID=370355 RepID=L7FKD8_ENTIV|nr:hypothetical protein EIN_004460 [Entamoeba invadens IP1]ELP86389.1 hypothetical protein EIN_004460 [Entamoeba invadens IP1]|eukprot:XP_004185735.1 hypothetical protein EIN_004460 [Entamoeba invadens IP1]